MGFKLRQLAPAPRAFTANLTPVYLTAGVPIAELYFGLYGRIVLASAAGGDGTVLLNQIDEVSLTRGGQTIIEIENGQDLIALMLAPWNDQSPSVTTGGSSGHYQYIKGLCLPVSLPPGAAGEYVLQVNCAGSTSTSGEYISLAEGWGRYAANYLGMNEALLNMQPNNGKHFHIVKRLFDPTAEGWGEPILIGAEGDLIGMLIYETTEQGQTITKDALSINAMRLDIGGERVIEIDSLCAHATQGLATGPQSDADYSFPQALFGEYIYVDFRQQPWDCRGKSVQMYVDAGSSYDAIRVYPIYLMDW